MSKLLISLGVVLLIAAAYFTLHKPCKPAPEGMVQAMQVDCLLQLISNRDEVKSEICASLHREANCQLVEATDKPAVDAFLNGKIRECVAANLKPKNFCTTNIPDAL